jgi:ferric-dicitrate binding protein FerR (iron transport regulator)
VTDEREEDQPYLWDRSGAPDPEVARLETLLAPLAHDAPLALKPETKADASSVVTRLETKRRNRRIAYAGIGALAIAAVVLWIVLVRPPRPADAVATCSSPSRGSHAFHAVGGAAKCGAEERASGFLPTGSDFETPKGTTATLEIARLGTVSIEPESKLRLIAADDKMQTLDLVRGTMHAKIAAPPRLFIVKTKRVDAVDLGCEYKLSVNDEGVGLLAVSYGSVSLERPNRALTLVVEGTTCKIGPNGPGTPLSANASAELRKAADDLDGGDATALDRVLAAAGEDDTATLWHVMRRMDPEERGRAWDRLSKLVPPPPSAPREAVVRGERPAIAGYKEALLPRWFKR